MIKIALKHWIYEQCVNVLFDNIYNNFKVNALVRQLKLGEHYSSIYTRFGSEYYNFRNCTVRRTPKHFRDSDVKISFTETIDYGQSPRKPDKIYEVFMRKDEIILRRQNIIEVKI